MKVVLFCGGLGLRIRDYAENVPKPMVPIGYRPVVWHVMKYYAHFGHKDFILCLGYRGDVIKNYFLNYSECISNDFILSDGGKKVELLNSDVNDWRITFADTGLHSNIGQRLKAVEHHLEGETEFLANYSDGLTDLPLLAQIEEMRQQDKVASFLCAKPNSSYHFVWMQPGGRVTAFQDVRESDLRVNAGYFVFKKEIFSYLHRGEELVREPFQRLIKDEQLLAHAYDGFWMSMDTFKDKQRLDDIYDRGDAPWEVWASGRNAIRKAG